MHGKGETLGVVDGARNVEARDGGWWVAQQKAKLGLASMLLVVGMLVAIAPLVTQRQSELGNKLVVVDVSTRPDGTGVVEVGLAVDATG